MKKEVEKKLINFFDSKANMARQFDVLPQVVHSWFIRAFPLKRAIECEKLTKGAITRQELRPDIFN